MIEVVSGINLVLTVIAVVVLFLLLIRRGAVPADSSNVIRDELRSNRDEGRQVARDLREELAARLQEADQTRSSDFNRLVHSYQERSESMARAHRELVEAMTKGSEHFRRTLEDRLKELRSDNSTHLKEVRDDLKSGLKVAVEAVSLPVGDLRVSQKTALDELLKAVRDQTDVNRAELEAIRLLLDRRVKELQEGNEKKLDEMRRTVDEKLQDSLERRLGESFKLVSDRLEAVHKGLGEMQNLATGVGDLKRVLTNVKVRGTWAEVQLGILLEQVLTPDQFARNVCVRQETTERVEFAIRLPGPKNDPDRPMWLPIDSKFPQEDYARLQEAAERCDAEAVQAAANGLARAVRASAKEISDKYVAPPHTTDFAIMFLPTEGLFAEVLRQPSLVEDLQQNFRVLVAGPTNFVAILTSLRMGFQTLAIEKRASETWRVLGAVKTEFGKFAEVLDKVKKQLDTASRSIDQSGVRSRAIARKLREVEQLPAEESSRLLSLPGVDELEDIDETSGGDA